MTSPLLERCLRDFGGSSRALAQGLREGPACSINAGAAGVAYFFYRLGREERDAELLTLAAAWVDRARRDAERADAFPHGEAKAAGASSLHHGAPGVHCVDALVSLARGDDTSARAAVARFVRAAAVADAHLDLTTGRAGLLVGAAAILDAGGAQAPFDRAALVAMGDAARDRLWRALDRLAPIARSKRFPTLGVAHGWAGLLFATLRWAQSTATPLGAGVASRLVQLAERGIANDADQIRWPLYAPATSDERGSLSGWCNGVAGHVFLWTLAHAVTGEPDFQILAHGAARTLAPSAKAPLGPRALVDLCCGSAGVAYALACAHRHGGERAWLTAARTLAAAVASRANRRGLRASLYRGDLGIALLEAELRRAATARMPLFEREPPPGAARLLRATG